MSPWQAKPGEQPLPQRVLVAYVALFASVSIALVAISYGVITNNHRISDIEKVRDAICNLRADQQLRIRRSEVYLQADSPPIPFVATDPEAQATARALVKQDVLDRRRVVDALAPLKCE